MIKIRFKWFIFSGLLLISLSINLGLVFRTKIDVGNNKDLMDKLKVYTDRDHRLVNMEKTLKTVYNLSDYEAHYYSVIFDDFSQKDSVSWVVYAALLRIESNFNPTVLSPAKCKGLAQVSEGTGKLIAERLGITFTDATLWNDLLNLVIGFTYFNEGVIEVKDSIKGDQALQHAIRRYCGGPGYSKINNNAKIYVSEYKSTMWQEYVKLSYIYKGVLYDDLKNVEQKKSILEKIFE